MNANSQAHGVAENLTRFAELCDTYGQDSTTEDMLSMCEHMDTVEEQNQCREDVEWLNDYVGDNCDNDWPCAWMSSALDVFAVMHYRPGRVDVEAVTVLVSTGGPHVEVSWSHSDVLTVTAWWGSDKAIKQVSCAPIAERLELIAAEADLAVR